ncbi:DNA replication factor Dna2-domain-containing protein, partial [Fennellomyces sp. T-0311]
RYNRYMVANISTAKYLEGDQGLSEKIVLLLDEASSSPARAHLREDWFHTVVQVGDVVHIPIMESSSNDIIIDNSQGYFIIHPDRLISSTAVAESFFCLRKSVLQQKIKSLGDYSEALVHGNLIHRIVQNALRSNDFSHEGLMEEARRVVQSSLEELLAIDQDENTALNILEKTISYIQSFGETYVGSQPKPNAIVASDIGPNIAVTLGCKNVAITGVLDVEEHLWSPTYGLKGMVDVSIEMAMQPSHKTMTIPLELKTGKSSRFISHRAQTILYTLLMSDRYDVDITAGALYYCRTNSLYMIEATRNDVRGLVMARNRLASAMQNRHTLPAMIKNLHSCQHCAMNDVCLLFHKSIENGDGSSSGLSGWFDMKTNHLNDNAAAMFRHWQRLIDLEEDDIDYIRRDIWRLPAELRELSGRCWNDMVFDQSQSNSSKSVVCFRRDTGFTENISMATSNISVGDPVVISSTAGHINLGMGFVLRLDQDSVQINLTSPLRRTPQRRDDFQADIRQVFVNNGQITKYRIDKDEMASGMALMRRNLVTLFAREEDNGDVKRRRLIVDRIKPSFVPIPPVKMPPTLNPAQQNAVEKVLSAKDYAIILGMPGTGKTTTTAHIIKALVERNKSVLLTAYTHSALDNVLVKVRESGIDVLRLGNPEKLTLPACVGPLRYADVFVLVGDQYQLPPLVRDDIARENGLQKSLFGLLAGAHPEAIAFLEYQYRMNEDIMTLSNTLVYDSKLKCANKSVANRQIELPQYREVLTKIHESGSSCAKQPCWIEQALDPR